jgi:transcription elongation factor Elf1
MAKKAIQKKNVMESSGPGVSCPYCSYEFQMFANAESFSMMRCTKCGKWFHAHIQLGAKPVAYLNPDEFQKETQDEDVLGEEAESSELLDEEPVKKRGKK